MFVKQEQHTLVIIQYIACGGEPEHQTKFQEMKNLIKGQSGPKGHIVGHLHLHAWRRIYIPLKFICREDKHYWVHPNSKLHPFYKHRPVSFL